MCRDTWTDTHARFAILDGGEFLCLLLEQEARGAGVRPGLEPNKYGDHGPHDHGEAHATDENAAWPKQVVGENYGRAPVVALIILVVVG